MVPRHGRGGGDAVDAAATIVPPQSLLLCKQLLCIVFADSAWLSSYCTREALITRHPWQYVSTRSLRERNMHTLLPLQALTRPELA